MVSKRTGLIVGTTALALASGAFYLDRAARKVVQTTVDPSLTLERVQALVKRSSHGNAVAERLLPNGLPGLTGAIVSANGQKFVAWITPDAKGLLVGALFNDQGDNLTSQAMKTDHDASQPSPAGIQDKPQPAKGELIDAVEKADGFMDGKSGLLVHAFIDLNCGYCSGLYRQLRPLIDQGELRVHWIPVAILHESSVALAAEVMQSPTPAAKLAEHEAQRNNNANGEGGLTGQPPTARTQQIIEANSGLLKVINEGLAATPMLLFRGQNGQVFQHAGLLREAGDLLAAGS